MERLKKALKVIGEAGADDWKTGNFESLFSQQAFEKMPMLEKFLHVSRLKVGDKSTRAWRRALLLLDYAEIDVSAADFNWEREKEKSFAKTEKKTDTDMKLLVRKRIDEGLNCSGLLYVNVNVALAAITKKWGGLIDNRVNTAQLTHGYTIQESAVLDSMPRGVTAYTTPTGYAKWPRKMVFFRGMWSFGTTIHECMHYCTSDEFWTKAVGNRDWSNPASTYHEGVTEFFTRKLCNNRQNYATEHQTVSLLMGKKIRAKAAVSETALENAYFKGEDVESIISFV